MISAYDASDITVVSVRFDIMVRFDVISFFNFILWNSPKGNEQWKGTFLAKIMISAYDASNLKVISVLSLIIWLGLMSYLFF